MNDQSVSYQSPTHRVESLKTNILLMAVHLHPFSSSQTKTIKQYTHHKKAETGDRQIEGFMVMHH